MRRVPIGWDPETGSLSYVRDASGSTHAQDNSRVVKEQLIAARPMFWLPLRGGYDQLTARRRLELSGRFRLRSATDRS